jgi:hypothetical protein
MRLSRNPLAVSGPQPSRLARKLAAGVAVLTVPLSLSASASGANTESGQEPTPSEADGVGILADVCGVSDDTDPGEGDKDPGARACFIDAGDGLRVCDTDADDGRFAVAAIYEEEHWYRDWDIQVFEADSGDAGCDTNYGDNIGDNWVLLKVCVRDFDDPGRNIAGSCNKYKWFEHE